MRLDSSRSIFPIMVIACKILGRKRTRPQICRFSGLNIGSDFAYKLHSDILCDERQNGRERRELVAIESKCRSGSHARRGSATAPSRPRESAGVPTHGRRRRRHLRRALRSRSRRSFLVFLLRRTRCKTLAISLLAHAVLYSGGRTPAVFSHLSPPPQASPS